MNSTQQQPQTDNSPDINAIGRNAKENYLMKKITICNNIDRKHHKGKLDMPAIAIQQEKVEKFSKKELADMLNKRSTQYETFYKDVHDKRIAKNNNPYKGIIKNFNYDQEIKSENNLIVYKVNTADKDAKLFADNKKNYDDVKKKEDTDIKNEYSESKKSTHAKKFTREQNKYSENIDSGNDNIRIDRIEFYKKEQEKQDNNKKKIDTIISSLIDGGAISNNLDSINYDKIDTDDLEKRMKSAFGEEEYKRMMLEMMAEKTK
jgi:hypothetical protein